MIGVFAFQAYRQKRPYRKELIVVTKVPAYARTWLMTVDQSSGEVLRRPLVLRMHRPQMTGE